MKFYALEELAEKCGTDNKYEITVKIAAEARRKSEEASRKNEEAIEGTKTDPANERFISAVLLEIEEGKSDIDELS